MDSIVQQLRRLQAQYDQYEGVDKLNFKQERHQGNGINVVLYASQVPSSFNQLMDKNGVSVGYIQPNRSVSIKLYIDRNCEFKANNK